MAHLSYKTEQYQNSRYSYTMGCPPLRGDNPRALASGLILSHVYVYNHVITILYNRHQCRPCKSWYKTRLMS